MNGSSRLADNYMQNAFSIQSVIGNCCAMYAARGARYFYASVGGSMAHVSNGRFLILKRTVKEAIFTGSLFDSIGEGL